ncbi:hypothetical protein, partial [Brevibacillus borstelensis]|uniref:hypothetical protein n=1 Tax=Brevibacillus borstelensis TaxID=45462 RepID=UPI003CED8645
PHKEYPLQLNSNGLSFYCLLKGDNISSRRAFLYWFDEKSAATITAPNFDQSPHSPLPHTLLTHSLF